MPASTLELGTVAVLQELLLFLAALLSPESGEAGLGQPGLLGRLRQPYSLFGQGVLHRALQLEGKPLG